MARGAESGHVSKFGGRATSASESVWPTYVGLTRSTKLVPQNNTEFFARYVHDARDVMDCIDMREGASFLRSSQRNQTDCHSHQ